MRNRDRRESGQAESARLILEAINDGFWDWNIPTGTARFSSRYYTLLGHEPYEFPQDYAAWKGLVHPEDIDKVEHQLREYIQRG